ncbi:hypothetical protein E9229_002452 [Paeniglutamicibacter cryotolerans]|uniref:PPM-type phosphatase domain-containing protein n=1 Tax=Paeniglutamicibacter cryotolerans TaxID=670079 RepID=A0A839QW75_9MICC|nr:hypothetical protein [Paeniglutamicibacter cryotolerans]
MFHKPEYAVVFDGASPLAGSVTADCSDAKWLVDALCVSLPRYLADASLDLAGCLALALEGILPRYLGCEGAASVPAYGVPSAGAVMVRVVDAELELLRIGDCSLVVGLRSGEFITMEDELLPALDANALSVLVETAARQGIEARAARPLINDELVANRQRMNEPGGYWILEPYGKGVSQASVLRVPLGEVRDVLLMTDGFSSAHDTLHLYANAPELLVAVRDTGVESVFGAIEAGFAADPTWNRYPRFKQIDDITAVHVVVGDVRAVGGTGTQ